MGVCCVLQSKSKKKKRRNELQVPRAPRNTTQALMDMDSMAGAAQDGMGPSSMPSMEGLLSRQSIAHRQWKDENESSDSDSDTEERTSAQSAGNRSAAQNPPRPHSPPSPHSPGSPASPPRSPPGTPGTALAALKAASSAAPPPLTLDDEDKDKRLRELEAENASLRARVAALEARDAKVPN
jgi:hypothetical protein